MDKQFFFHHDASTRSIQVCLPGKIYVSFMLPLLSLQFYARVLKQNHPNQRTQVDSFNAAGRNRSLVLSILAPWSSALITPSIQRTYAIFVCKCRFFFLGTAK